MGKLASRPTLTKEWADKCAPHLGCDPMELVMGREMGLLAVPEEPPAPVNSSHQEMTDKAALRIALSAARAAMGARGTDDPEIQLDTVWAVFADMTGRPR